MLMGVEATGAGDALARPSEQDGEIIIVLSGSSTGGRFSMPANSNSHSNP